MEVYQGKSVFGGIAIGRISVHKKDEQQVKRVKIENPDLEIARYRQARQTAMEQLQNLYQKALKEVGEANAAIFEIHQMMLEDEEYLESMENMIRIELVNAEYAAAATGDNFAEMFAAMDDEYMKARSADVKDISERLVRNLSGEGDNDLSSMEPSIIVADDLSPSETVQMDKEKILAFVTVHGSTNSHTAILARMMNIPALIGVPMDLNSLKTGMTAVVDGFSGQVIFEPEEDVQKETEKRMQEEAEKQKLLEELKGKENITPGQRHKIIGTFEEITASVPEKSLVYGKKSSGGRNNEGKMTMRYIGGGHRKVIRIVDFKRNKDGVPAVVKTIEYDPNRSARIALLFYADGEKRYIIAPNGLQVGATLMSGESAAPEIGNALPLQNIPVGTVIHNIELQYRSEERRVGKECRSRW